MFTPIGRAAAMGRFPAPLEPELDVELELELKELVGPPEVEAVALEALLEVVALLDPPELEVEAELLDPAPTLVELLPTVALPLPAAVLETAEEETPPDVPVPLADEETETMRCPVEPPDDAPIPPPITWLPVVDAVDRDDERLEPTAVGVHAVEASISAKETTSTRITILPVSRHSSAARSSNPST
jgi:hypothetical protein